MMLTGIYRFILLFSFSVSVNADRIELVVSSITDSPNLHIYYHDLLISALEADGNEIVVDELALPHNRLRKHLDAGFISIAWLIESRERNEKYHRISVGLTNGLIGKRILFIRKQDQPLFDQVQSLEDLRRLDLFAGFGMNWFDAKVWRLNDLQYREHSGNWRSIFRMVQYRRRFDYFPRGTNEILSEAAEHPNLAIEKRLILRYDRDFLFYLSKQGPNAGVKYAKQIEAALVKAKKSGLIDEMVKTYWGRDFEALDYQNRRMIELDTPAL